MKRQFILSLIVVAVLCLLGNPGFSQRSETGRIEGTVIDKSGEPMPNVYVTDTYTRKKTVTDDAGRFSIEVLMQDNHLRFTHVGFRTENRQIDLATMWKAEGQPLEILVVLQKKGFELPIAEIVADEPVERFAPKNVSVVDFTFIEDSEDLLLLVRKERNTYLQRLNSNRQVVKERQVAGRARGFLRDCLGNIHLDMADQVGLLVETVYSWNVMQEVTREQYDRVFKNCVAVNDDLVVFRQLTMLGSEVKYIAVSRKMRTSAEMISSFDRLRFLGMAENARTFVTSDVIEEIRRLYLPFVNPELFDCVEALAAGSPGWIEPVKPLLARENKQIRPDDMLPVGWVARYNASVAAVFRRLNAGDLLLRFPIYCPLFTTESGFVFFDHIHGVGIHLNHNGTFAGSFPIDHHEQRGWRKQIMKDELAQRFYSRSTLNGFPLLTEINLATGEFASQFVLKSGHNPDEMKIRDGKAYFTAVDHRSPYRKLFVWNFRELSADLTQLD